MKSMCPGLMKSRMKSKFMFKNESWKKKKASEKEDAKKMREIREKMVKECGL